MIELSLRSEKKLDTCMNILERACEIKFVWRWEIQAQSYIILIRQPTGKAFSQRD